MATFNGEKWLSSQIQSLIDQKNVKINIFIRDDGSTDNTVKIIKKYKETNNIDLKLNKKKQRSAPLNFLQLIMQTNDSFDYYAFSDQDDIWDKGKISRALKKLDLNKCEAYSSNIKIIKNHKKILTDKSANQKKYDYIFESVPGCTTVLTRNSFLKIKKRLQRLKKNQLKKIIMHDAFIYFFLRANKIPWYIDKKSFIYYRQHENNVFGVNYGFGLSKKNLEGMKKRLKMITSGYYRNYILDLAKIINVDIWVIKSIKRLNFLDRVKLILNSFEFRRSKLGCFYIILIFLIMTNKK